MARTDRFRQQHDELLNLARELSAHLDAKRLAQDAGPARTCLGKLMGKLVVHLATEDKVLYPELMGHSEATVATLARRFSQEMKNTTTQVVAYNDRWSTATAIKARPDDFIRETQQVIAILGDRIKRENNELYATADRIEGKAFA